MAVRVQVPPSAPINDWFASGNDSQFGDITKWFTVAVTNMSAAFRDRTSFNADISDWNISNVTSMGYMFEATALNQNIGSWSVFNVLNCLGFSTDAGAFISPNFDFCTP